MTPLVRPALQVPRLQTFFPLTVACLALGLLSAGCGSGGPPPSVTTSSLPAGSAARAGAELVSAATVARIAARQGIPMIQIRRQVAYILTTLAR